MYCDECGFKNKKNAKFCKNCGANLEESEQLEEKKEQLTESKFSDNNDDKKIKKKDLIKYLSVAKELEINKLGLENSIKDLNELDNKKYSEIIRPTKQKEKPKKNTAWFKEGDGSFFFIIFIVLTILFYHFIFKNSWEDVFFNIILVIGALFDDNFWISMLIAGGICIGIMILITIYSTIKGTIKYNSDLQNYKKETKNINKKNSEQLVIYNEQKEIIVGRISNIEKDLDDVTKTLNKYYDVDVIYPKYRNLVAVTTFIEYLESGRCKSLYGYTGCYNVYEQEIRQNAIIGKLDQVLAQLDQIKKVQFATYLAVQESNALKSALVNTCNNMLEENKRANAMLEAQAQDTKIIKRNSEIISTISTLNYIKK